MSENLKELVSKAEPGEKCDVAYCRLLPDNLQPYHDGFNAEHYVSLSDWRDAWRERAAEVPAAEAPEE